MTEIAAMGLTNSDRELGILRAEVDHLKEDVREVKADVKLILQALNEQSGGRKALWALLAAAGTIGGLVGTLAGVIIKYLF